MKLTVIAPVYNVEKYLRSFIESVLNQDFQDYEFILVDDGSPDNSGKICDEYAEKDKRIKVIHKVNGGVDSARNRGMEEATGDYFYFADSDDALLAGCLSTLVYGMQQSPTNELAIGGYLYSRDGKIEEKADLQITERNYTREEVMEELIHPQHFALGMPWTNLYKASVIRDNKLQFNKDIHTIDDRLFMVEYINAMKGTAYHTNRPVYVYNLGIGVSFQIKKKFDKRQATIFYGQCLIYEIVKNGGFSSKAKWWARHVMINSFDKKRAYFKEYNDLETVKKLDKRFYSIATRWEYIRFKIREKTAVYYNKSRRQ